MMYLINFCGEVKAGCVCLSTISTARRQVLVISERVGERVMEGEVRSDQVCVIALAPATMCPLAFVAKGHR